MNQAQAVSTLVEEKKIDEVTREINLIVAYEEIVSAKRVKLASLTKTVKVDGFRKGHVPLNVVERIYGDRVLHEVAQDLCWASWQRAAKKNKLQPISQPDFTISSIEAGKPIDFRVSYEVMPKITLGDYSSVQIEMAEAEVSESDVDKTIEKILQNATHWHSVDRLSKSGDGVEVDMSYTIFPRADNSEEKPVEQSSKGEKLVLDDSQFTLPELLPHLTGVQAGDKVQCDITISDTFPNESWRGRKSHFDIEVQKVLHAHTPVLDEDFAHKSGVSKDDVDAIASFRKRVEQNLNLEVKAVVNKNFKRDLFQEVVDKTTVHVPKSIVDYYNRRIRREMVTQYYPPEELKKLKGNPEDILPAENFVEQAKHQASVSLLVSEIVQQQEIKVSKEEIDAEIEKHAVQYDDAKAFVKHIKENKESLENFENFALENAVVRWLQTQVKIKKTTKSYQELVHPDTNIVNNADSQQTYESKDKS